MVKSLDEDEASLFTSSLFIVVVALGMLWALISGWKTPEVVMFLGLVIVWNAGTISDGDALSGFHSQDVLVVGALCVVVQAVEGTGVAVKFTRRILGAGTRLTTGLLRLVLITLVMSTFFDNTAVVALMIPITRDWARLRGFSEACLLMPLSFVSMLGGLLTLFSGGSNTTIRGMLQDAFKEDPTIQTLHTFDPGFVGFPLAMASIVYLLMAAPRWLSRTSEARDAGIQGDEARGMAPSDRELDGSGRLVTELEITHGLESVNQTVGSLLCRLGLPMESLISLKQRRDPRFVFQRDASIDNSEPGRALLQDSHGGSAREAWAEGHAITRAWVVVSSVLTAARQGTWVPTLAWRRRPYALLEGDGRDGSLSAAKDTGISSSTSVEMTTLGSAEEGELVLDAPSSTGEVGHRRRLCCRAKEDRTQPAVTMGDDSDRHGLVPANDADFEIIDWIQPDTKVGIGDVLVLSCCREQILAFQRCLVRERMSGFNILGVRSQVLSKHGTTFFELVLSRHSRFLGLSAAHDNTFLVARYGCCITALRSKRKSKDGQPLPPGAETVGSSRPMAGDASGIGEGSSPKHDSAFLPLLSSPLDFPSMVKDSTGDRAEATGTMDTVDTEGGRRSAGRGSAGAHPPPEDREGRERRGTGESIRAGDLIVVIANQDFLQKFPSASSEFLHKRRLGSLAPPESWANYSPLAVFAAMLAWALAFDVSMVRAVFAACAMLILGGLVDDKLAVGYVDWGLLLLIGSAHGFSKSVVNSGLAGVVGGAIRASGMGPSSSVFCLFGFTMLCTQVASNDAAVALTLPIALDMARELEVDCKPFVIAVLISASCSLLTPIGSPTNAMVWKCGGYRFGEYAKVGAPLALLYWIAASALIPFVFPF